MINNVTGRGVKLIEVYNNKITKDESQKQYLLQVTSDYSKKYPDHQMKHLHYNLSCTIFILK